MTSWKCIDLIKQFWSGVKIIRVKRGEGESSCYLTPSTTARMSVGSVLRVFRFVGWFGVGGLGTICRSWEGSIWRSLGCNFLGWVGVSDTMRNAQGRHRGSGGSVNRGQTMRRRGCSSKPHRHLDGGPGPISILIF